MAASGEQGEHLEQASDQAHGIAPWKEELVAASARVASLSAEIASLQKENASSRVATLEEEVTKLESGISSLEAVLLLLEAEKAATVEKNAALEAENGALRTELEGLRGLFSDADRDGWRSFLAGRAFTQRAATVIAAAWRRFLDLVGAAVADGAAASQAAEPPGPAEAAVADGLPALQQPVPSDLVVAAGADGAAAPPKPSSSGLLEAVLVYPGNDPGAVVLKKGDFLRLDPGEFLNDSVIDFYLKYIEVVLLPREQERRAREGLEPLRFHFFNSFFFTRLRQEGYEAVRKWTREADIFRADYLFVPVHESRHWSLAIICNPGRIRETDASTLPPEQRPAILHLCSLGVDKPDVYSTLLGYLQSALVDKDRCRASPAPDAPGGPPPVPPEAAAAALVPVPVPVMAHDQAPEELAHVARIQAKVPAQVNYCDCGVFVLEYVERFVQQPLERVLRGRTLAVQRPTWFDVEAVMAKRSEIQKLIVDLAGPEVAARLGLEAKEPCKFVDADFEADRARQRADGEKAGRTGPTGPARDADEEHGAAQASTQASAASIGAAAFSGAKPKPAPAGQTEALPPSSPQPRASPTSCSAAAARPAAGTKRPLPAPAEPARRPKPGVAPGAAAEKENEPPPTAVGASSAAGGKLGQGGASSAAGGKLGPADSTQTGSRTQPLRVLPSAPAPSRAGSAVGKRPRDSLLQPEDAPAPAKPRADDRSAAEAQPLHSSVQMEADGVARSPADLPRAAAAGSSSTSSSSSSSSSGPVAGPQPQKGSSPSSRPASPSGRLPSTMPQPPAMSLYRILSESLAEYQKRLYAHDGAIRAVLDQTAYESKATLQDMARLLLAVARLWKDVPTKRAGFVKRAAARIMYAEGNGRLLWGAAFVDGREIVLSTVWGSVWKASAKGDDGFDIAKRLRESATTSAAPIVVIATDDLVPSDPRDRENRHWANQPKLTRADVEAERRRVANKRGDMAGLGIEVMTPQEFRRFIENIAFEFDR